MLLLAHLVYQLRAVLVVGLAVDQVGVLLVLV
jgi:hypothetical protein